MKMWKRTRKLLRNKRHLVVILACLLVIVLTGFVYAAVARPWRAATTSGSTHVTFASAQKQQQATQQMTSQSGEASSQSATTDTTSANSATSTPKSSSSSSVQSFTPSPAPAPQPFAVSYVVLNQPNIVCSSEGSYIAQIGDVIVGLGSVSGGAITYGFEVSGDIPDSWAGYRQNSNVAAGTWSTSFNQMYWGSMNDPHMAYTELIPWGHGAGAIRAVVYSPNTVYSSWFNVPAQAVGQSC